MTIAWRIHLFSFRTQKLSFSAPKVLVGWLTGRIGRCHIPLKHCSKAVLFCCPFYCSFMFILINNYSDNIIWKIPLFSFRTQKLSFSAPKVLAGFVAERTDKTVVKRNIFHILLQKTPSEYIQYAFERVSLHNTKSLPFAADFLCPFGSLPWG